MNIIARPGGKEDGSGSLAEVRCDRERNARYLNWKCVRIEARSKGTALVALLTSHIAEEGIGTGIPLISSVGDASIPRYLETRDFYDALPRQRVSRICTRTINIANISRLMYIGCFAGVNVDRLFGKCRSVLKPDMILMKGLNHHFI